MILLYRSIKEKKRGFMLQLFAPKKYIKDYRFVDFNDLKKQGIKLLICDIDNTLAAHDQKHPDEKVKKFIKSVQAQHFEICLISNNVSERVETFAKELHLPTYPMAKKPLKKTYRKIIEDYRVNPHEIAAIGDQLLTDVLGGNRMGIYTILTVPLYQKDLIWTKINRTLENQVFKRLEKKGYLKKGECDE